MAPPHNPGLTGLRWRETTMAITRLTRQELAWKRASRARKEGMRSAVSSLRNFARIEGDPAGREALLRAAAALASVHDLPAE